MQREMEGTLKEIEMSKRREGGKVAKDSNEARRRVARCLIRKTVSVSLPLAPKKRDHAHH